MLCQLRRVALPTFFALTVFVSSAAAECAWVLWGHTSSSGSFMVLPVDAFKTREDCQAEKASRDTQTRAEIKEGRGTSVVLFSCLPDTVDPRGPKGK